MKPKISRKKRGELSLTCFPYAEKLCAMLKKEGLDAMKVARCQSYLLQAGMKMLEVAFNHGIEFEKLQALKRKKPVRVLHKKYTVTKTADFIDL